MKSKLMFGVVAFAIVLGGMQGIWADVLTVPLRIFGFDTINSIALSPDGKRILLGCDSIAYLIDTATLSPTRSFAGHAGAINALVFSRDGSRVLSGSADSSARLWDASTGKLLRTFSGHKGIVNSVALSPDGSRAFTGSDDSTARLWDASTGKLIRTFSGHAGAVNSLAVSPDGSQVVTGSIAEYTALLWNVSTGKVIGTFPGLRGSYFPVAFSPDGSKVLTGSGNSGALWDVSADTLIDIFVVPNYYNAPNPRVVSIAFSPDGSKILISHTSGAVNSERSTIWDAFKRKSIQNTGGTNLQANSMFFFPGGSKVLYSMSNNIAIIDTAGTMVKSSSWHSDEVVSAAFSPNDSMVLTSSADGTAKLWDAACGSVLRTFTGGRLATFSFNGLYLLTCSSDAVTLLTASTGEKLLDLSGYAGSLNSAVFSPNDSFVLSVSSDCSATLWNVYTGAVKGKISGNIQLISFTGSRCNGWTTVVSSTGPCDSTSIDSLNIITSVAFSPDGSKVLTGSFDGTAKLWSASSGGFLKIFTGHGDKIFSVAFSPDGSKILTGSADNTAKLWEISTCSDIRTFSGHSDRVSSAVFSPDGSRVLTGSFDGTAKLWNSSTGTVMRTFSPHRGRINSAVFSRDGLQVLTGSQDCSAKLWDASDITGSPPANTMRPPAPRPLVSMHNNRLVICNGSSLPEGGAGIVIYNALGRTIARIMIKTPLSSAMQEFPIPWFLDQGMYLYKFSGPRGVVKTGMFRVVNQRFPN